MQRSRQVCGRGTMHLYTKVVINVFCQNGIYKGKMVKVSNFVHPTKSFKKENMFW